MCGTWSFFSQLPHSQAFLLPYIVHISKDKWPLVNSYIRFILLGLNCNFQNWFHHFLCLKVFLPCHWPMGHSLPGLFLLITSLVCFSWFFLFHHLAVKELYFWNASKYEDCHVKISAWASSNWDYKYLSSQFLSYLIHLWVVYLTTTLKIRSFHFSTMSCSESPPFLPLDYCTPFLRSLSFYT